MYSNRYSPFRLDSINLGKAIQIKIQYERIAKRSLTRQIVNTTNTNSYINVFMFCKYGDKESKRDRKRAGDRNKFAKF